MSPALVHPAVAAINGEERVQPLPLSYVERALGTEYQESLAALAETPAYQAFEKLVSGPDGWPDPAEPIVLTQRRDGGWSLISGGHVFLAARALGLPRMDVLILRNSEVPVWQTALNRAEMASRAPEPEESEDDLYLRVIAYHAGS